MLSLPLQHRRSAAGFTLVELLIALVVLGILAMVAIPGYQAQVRKARRAEAIAAILAIQQAQERWRASHATYAARLGSDGLPMAARSATGRHALGTSVEPDTAGFAYAVDAVAGDAAGDPCAHLRLEMHRGSVTQRSGRDAQLGNGAADNRACWGQ
jgi:type IV pilus assembly protein PilE